MSDLLRNLLHQADAATDQVPLPPDFASRIRARARQRRRRRALLTTLAIIVPLTLAILLVSQSPRAPKPGLVNNIPSPPPATSNQLAAVPEASLAIDPVADLRDDAALTMVVIARRRARTLGPQDAAEVYQRTIALYPDTHWAAIARTELAALPH
jgi:hypothetical protein